MNDILGVGGIDRPQQRIPNPGHVRDAQTRKTLQEFQKIAHAQLHQNHQMKGLPKETMIPNLDHMGGPF